MVDDRRYTRRFELAAALSTLYSSVIIPVSLADTRVARSRWSRRFICQNLTHRYIPIDISFTSATSIWQPRHREL